jgi:hypothetical protein
MPRTSYVYKPECYLADQFGMVEKNEEYWLWLSSHTPDNRMMIGNQVQEFRFNSDTMEPTRHMINSKMYTSKKKFRAETKAHGCIEVGDQTHHLTKSRTPQVMSRRQRREDIKRALYEVRNGRDIMQELRSVPKE